MPNYTDALEWARKREELPAPDDFYVYKEAFDYKAGIILEGISSYLSPYYDYVYYHAFLHYCIVTDYQFTYEMENEQGEMENVVINNPGYLKYKIAEKGFITSSASDESSSASIHVTKSLNEGDFLMSDLIRTPYGSYVYSVLEQLNVGPVLL